MCACMCVCQCGHLVQVLDENGFDVDGIALALRRRRSGGSEGEEKRRGVKVRGEGEYGE